MGLEWRADVAPELLSEAEREQLIRAKAKGEAREALESLIPKDLLYTKKGWPTCIPTRRAADMLCGVRRQVADLIGLDVKYTEPGKLIERYVELWTERQRRAA